MIPAIFISLGMAFFRLGSGVSHFQEYQAYCFECICKRCSSDTTAHQLLKLAVMCMSWLSRWQKEAWSTTPHGCWSWFSCTRPRTCATAWWHWGPPVLARRAASTPSWSPWLSAEFRTRRCAWTPRPSLPHRCLVAWTWPPTTGLMASSPPSGAGHIKLKRWGKPSDKECAWPVVSRGLRNVFCYVLLLLFLFVLFLLLLLFCFCLFLSSMLQYLFTSLSWT